MKSKCLCLFVSKTQRASVLRSHEWMKTAKASILQQKSQDKEVAYIKNVVCCEQWALRNSQLVTRQVVLI